MSNKKASRGYLQRKAAEETRNFGVQITPERLSVIVRNSSAKSIPIWMTDESDYMLIVLDVKDFASGKTWTQ